MLCVFKEMQIGQSTQQIIETERKLDTTVFVVKYVKYGSILMR
jgi:hypothetical protein